MKLAPGRHTLAAWSPQAAVTRRIFSVPEAREVTVMMPSSSGTLLVSSSPAGALILVDGADRGNTPASLRLSRGQHHLTVVNGSHRAEEVVEIDGDQLVTRTYRW
jgi:hypothetical protein